MLSAEACGVTGRGRKEARWENGDQLRWAGVFVLCALWEGDLWARQYDRELSHVLALQGEIAQDVAGEIQAALAETKHALPAPQISLPASYEAYDLYLQGRYFWNKRTKEGFQRASDYFQQAIARDHNFARAYASWRTPMD
jgi:hypothetical protein